MNYFKEIKVPERAGTPSLCFSGFVSRGHWQAQSSSWPAGVASELDGQLWVVHAGLCFLLLPEPLDLCVLTATWGSSVLCVQRLPLTLGVLSLGGSARCASGEHLK